MQNKSEILGLDLLLSKYSSIKQGEGRGHLFEGRLLFLILADREGAYSNGALILRGGANSRIYGIHKGMQYSIKNNVN